MSDASEFFAGTGGMAIGDYQVTERVDLMLPAYGQDINNYGYNELEPVIPLSNKVGDVKSIANSSLSRAFCVVSSGELGYRGEDGQGTIHRVDFVTGLATTVETSAGASSGFFDACCSDIGDKIFVVGASGATTLSMSVSVDGGVTWADVTIFNSGFANLGSPSAANKVPLVSIECNPRGDTIRVTMHGTDTNSTVVYESTDSGATMGEVLTPRQTLTAAKTTGASAVSKNMETTVILSATQLYISENGTGVLTNTATNFPTTMSSNLRVAISDDGVTICVYDITSPTPGRVTLYVTKDGGTLWREVNLSIAKIGVGTVPIAASFDANNNDIVFVIVGTTGEIYEVDLDLLSIKIIGSAEVNLNPAISIQSDFKTNGAGHVFGISDPITQEVNMNIGITNGKILLNTIGDTKPLKVYAGGQSKGLGFSWKQVTSPINTDIRNTYVSDDKTVIVMCGFGGVGVYSTDSGVTFNKSADTAGSFSADGASDSSVILTSSQGKVYRSVNDGVNWAAVAGLSDTGVTTADNYHACSCILSGGTFIVGSRNGNLDISTDSGANFTLLTTPFSLSTDTQIRSAIIAKGDDQIMFVGNMGGKIKRTINGGTTFVDPTTPPVVSVSNDIVYDLACSSNGATVLAIIDSQVFRSSDTGDTWIEVAVGFSKSPYREITISTDGLTVFVTNNDGLLLRSFDGGVTFQKTDVQWENTRRKARGIRLAPDGSIAFNATDDGLIYKTT